MINQKKLSLLLRGYEKMDTDVKKLRQYLLGNLSESEAEKLDLQIIGDKNLEEELSLAEDSLMEDYLDETLLPAESELFHKNFLISEARRDQLKELAVLKTYAQNTIRQEASDNQEDKFFQKLKNAFSLNLRPVALAFGLLVVGILAIAVWQFGLSGSTSQLALLENQAAAMNAEDLSNLRKYENLSKLSLFSDLLRSSDETAKLSGNALSDRVLLRLALPMEETSNVFSAKITRHQTESLSLNKIPAYNNRSGKEVRLILPSTFLKNGEYKIELLPENGKDFPINYSFAVQ